MPGKHEKIDVCPFCGKEGLRVWDKPSYKKTSHLSDKSSRAPMIDRAQFKILSDCPHCGKTVKQIQDYYDGKTEIDHKKLLERLRREEMPTKIVFE